MPHSDLVEGPQPLVEGPQPMEGCSSFNCCYLSSFSVLEEFRLVIDQSYACLGSCCNVLM